MIMIIIILSIKLDFMIRSIIMKLILIIIIIIIKIIIINNDSPL